LLRASVSADAGDPTGRSGLLTVLNQEEGDEGGGPDRDDPVTDDLATSTTGAVAMEKLRRAGSIEEEAKQETRGAQPREDENRGDRESRDLQEPRHTMKVRRIVQAAAGRACGFGFGFVSRHWGIRPWRYSIHSDTMWFVVS